MRKRKQLLTLTAAAVLVCLMAGPAAAETGPAAKPALDGIVITALPEAGDGVLTYAGRALLTGEGIPAEHLDRLAYEPAARQRTEYTYLPVYRDGSVGAATTDTIAAASNARPAASDGEIRTYRNLPVRGVFPVRDDGAAYSCHILTQPGMGMVTVEGGTYVYTPYQNRTGTDVFTYIVQDETGAWSEEAGIRVNIERQRSDLVYSDLAGDSAAYAAVRLAEEGVYTGRSIGGVRYFEPAAVLSRGEFTAMALAALGREPASPASLTVDGADSIPVWIRGYLAAAVQEGIVTGGDSAALRPADGITLAEAAVILSGAMEAEAVPRRLLHETEIVPVWAEDAVARLEADGILSPAAVEALGGGHPVTRGEAAELLLRALEEKPRPEKTGLFSWTTAD